MHTLKIKAGPLGQGTLEVDGVSLTGIVRGVAIGINAGEANEVHLILAPGQIELEIDVKEKLLTIQEETQAGDEEAALWEKLTDDERTLRRFIVKDPDPDQPPYCTHGIGLDTPCTFCHERFPNDPSQD